MAHLPLFTVVKRSHNAALCVHCTAFFPFKYSFISFRFCCCLLLFLLMLIFQRAIRVKHSSQYLIKSHFAGNSNLRHNARANTIQYQFLLMFRVLFTMAKQCHSFTTERLFFSYPGQLGARLLSAFAFRVSHTRHLQQQTIAAEAAEAAAKPAQSR